LHKYRRTSILECVEDKAPHGDSPAEAMARRLKALADPARLRIVHILAESDNRPVCVCDFVGPLGISQPTVSHHLKVLTEADILTRDKRGTWAYYTLVDPSLADHLAALVPRLTQ